MAKWLHGIECMDYTPIIEQPYNSSELVILFVNYWWGKYEISSNKEENISLYAISFFCSGNFNMLHVNFENLTFNSFFWILKYDKSCFKFNFVQNETFTIFRYVLIIYNYQTIKKHLDIDIFLYIYNSPWLHCLQFQYTKTFIASGLLS